MTGSGKSIDKKVMGIFLNADNTEPAAVSAPKIDTISDMSEVVNSANMYCKDRVLSTIGIPQYKIDELEKCANFVDELKQYLSMYYTAKNSDKNDKFSTMASHLRMAFYYVNAIESCSDVELKEVTAILNKEGVGYQKNPL